MDSLQVANTDPMTPAAASMARDVGRMRLESNVETLCKAFDAGGMDAALRHYHWANDGVRMEFGRRRRAQLFELGWIV